MTVKRNYLHVLWRVPVLIITLIVMPIMFLIGKALRIPQHAELVHLFHHFVCLILGLRKHFTGTISQARPTLYISNHVSYLDIFVLGGLRAYFIAKSEVANWPILGPLSRFQNTLFFERKAGKAREQLKIMQSHLSTGQRLTLFAEGTSTDGTHVVPFKSSLFEAANLSATVSSSDKTELRELKVAIQPISITYTHYDGQKMDQAARDNYAWYATTPFTSHFFNIFRLKNVDVKVHFHPVCYLEDFETRKQCSDHCHKLVAERLAEFINEA